MISGGITAPVARTTPDSAKVALNSTKAHSTS